MRAIGRGLFLIVLTIMLTEGMACPPLSWGGENVRLFFRKTTTSRPPDDRKKHVVREGEWLYKILEDAGIPREDFPRIIPQVRSMNPHIEDFNHLRAGQVLYLPLLPEHSPISSPPPKLAQEAGGATKTYIVRPGETILQILTRETGASRAEIYSHYLPIIRQRNPHITNLDTLRPGDRLELPDPGQQAILATSTSKPMEGMDGPAGRAAFSDNGTRDTAGIVLPGGTGPAGAPGEGTVGAPGQGLAVMTEGTNPPTAPAPSQPPALSPQPSLKNLLVEGRHHARQALQALGWTAVPGDHGLFPLDDGSWFAVDLKETPLFLTPWGERLLLLDAPKPAAWIEKARSAGLLSIIVPADWAIRPLFQAIAAALPQRLRLWSPDRPLVLPRQRLNVTLKAPLLLVLPQDGGRTVAFWPRGAQEPPLPQGVREALADVDITMVETDSSGAVTPFPSFPAQAIYLPEAGTAWLHAQLDEQFPTIRPLTSAGQILATLRHEGHLVSRHLTLSWIRGHDRALTLQVPAWVITGTPPIALLEETSPAVAALLAREGYRCARMSR